MAHTILYGARETELAGATTDGARVWVPLDDLERATGWDSKPQGLCQGDTCVPIPPDRRAAWLDEKSRRLDLAAFAAHLGQAMTRDEKRGVTAFGPAARGGKPAGTGPVAAPDFRLPDLDGKLHSLSEHRGKKVLLYCWASW